MNSPEYMAGTNRIVIKGKDDSKAIITRDYLNGDTLSYLVNFTSNLDNVLSEKIRNLGYVIFVDNISIDDDTATITGTLVENMALKEEYHVDGEFFIKLNVSYVPYPEETTSMIPITFCLDKIKEMTGDLEMFQDMVDEGRLDATTKDLIKYGITIKPQFSIVSRNDNNNINSNEVSSNIPLLTLINGRDDIKQKKKSKR